MAAGRSPVAESRGRAGRFAVALVAGLLLAVALSEAQPPATQRPLAGRSLEAVLRELQAAGLPIVFSSAVVGSELRVLDEPAENDPRRLLDEILAAHGLAVRETRGGQLAVVRGTPDVAARELRGQVRSAADGQSIGGARVRVAGETGRVETDRFGRFRVRAPAAGELTIQLDATGYRSLVLHLAAAATTGQLAIELEPLPVARERIEVSSSDLDSAASPVSGGALDRLDLERRPELAGDPLRAAGRLPGITTQHSARPLVRGGEAGSVGIEVDGVELYEPYHLLDFGGLLSIVPADVLAELEVDTGSVDASRGDRLSGVLDMTTLVPDWRLRGAVEAGPVLASASASGQGSESRYRWLGSLRLGLLDSVARALDLDQEPSYWDAFAKGTIAIADAHELRLQALGAADRLEAESEEPGAFEDYSTRHDSQYLWLAHQAILNEHAWVEQRVSASEVDGDRSGEARFELDRFRVLDVRRLDVFAVRHDGYASLGAHHELQWGAELRQINADFRYDGELRLVDPVAAVRTNPPMLDAAYAVSLDGRQEAIYVQDRWRAGARITLLAGLRRESGSLWDEQFLHPRVQLAHQVTKRDRWSLAWGRYSQSRRPYELPVEDGEQELRALERSRELVLGYRRTLGSGIELALEAFERTVRHPQSRWTNLFDPFSIFPETEPDRVLVPVERVTARGAALSIVGRLSSRLGGSFSASRTLVRERNQLVRQREDDVEAPGAGDLPWDLRLGLDWDPARRWSLRAAWRVSEGSPTTPLALGSDAGGVLVPVLGELRSERLRDLHSLDLELVREWALARGSLQLVLEVENAYNASNARGYEYELVEDAGATRIERRELLWPGRLPSFRVRWVF